MCLRDCQQTEHCRGATEGSITVTGSHVVDTSLSDTLHFIPSWLLVIADSGGETVRQLYNLIGETSCLRLGAIFPTLNPAESVM